MMPQLKNLLAPKAIFAYLKKSGFRSPIQSRLKYMNLQFSSTHQSKKGILSMVSDFVTLTKKGQRSLERPRSL